MTTYFFDTNILFKTFFNNVYFDKCELKDYFDNDSINFISKNVDYEFSNIFLDFSNQINQFLIEPYFKLNELSGNITFKKYKELTRNIEVLKFNNAIVSKMIWKTVNPNNDIISVGDFQDCLKEYILNFNRYFHFKYNDLLSCFSIHNRFEKYPDIESVLTDFIHKSDLNICLDAHDVAVQNNIDDLVFVSADKIFNKNSELILENTKIRDIIQIR